MPDNEIVHMSLNDQVTYAKTIAGGSLVPMNYRNSPANVLIAIGFGQAMGLSPAESLYRVNVINGKPTASAELIAAQVRKAGHKLRIAKDEQAVSVTATIIRADDPDYPFTATRDKAWAESMGLLHKDQYVKQPLTMLTWRAITAVAREACPEALYGVVYTPDEMTDVEHEPSEVPVDNLVVETPRTEPASAPDATAQETAATVDLGPVRERFKAYKSAIGLTPKGATDTLCKVVGVVDMQHMTAESVAKAITYMDDIIAQDAEYDAEVKPKEDAKPDKGELPDVYPEDVDF